MAEASGAGRQLYWSSPVAFVFVATGATIGMADIWRLPLEMQRYGGGAFLLIYLLALVFMMLPVLMAQLLIGRYARADIVGVFEQLVTKNRQNRAWICTGYFMLIGSFLVLTYSSVFAGWGVGYTVHSAASVYRGLGNTQLHQVLTTLAGSPEKALGWYTLFLAVVGMCSARGIHAGLESAARALVIVSFAILFVLLFVVISRGTAGGAVAQLLHMDFFALGWRGVLEACYQAFFTLAVGGGVMIGLGGYLDDNTRLLPVGLAVVVLDVVFTCLSAVVVVGMLDSGGSLVSTGLRLLFADFPAAVFSAGYGWLVPLFFLVVVCTSITAALGLLELPCVWMMRRFGISRVYAVTMTVLLAWLVGLGTLLSFNMLATATLFFGRNFFGWVELLTARILLPVAGLLVCLFVGRFLPPHTLEAAWHDNGPSSMTLWRWCLRFPARVGVVLVLAYSLGLATFFAVGA